MTVVYASFGDAGAERACEVIGTRMAVAGAMAMPELACDPAISPADLTAGMIKAHMLGAASAILGAQWAGQLDQRDADQIVRHAARVLAEAIDAMREVG